MREEGALSSGPIYKLYYECHVIAHYKSQGGVGCRKLASIMWEKEGMGIAEKYLPKVREALRTAR